MDAYNESELTWRDTPRTLQELVFFKQKVKKFKLENASQILASYMDDFQWCGNTYPRFKAQNASGIEGIRNVGIFSTALCLDILSGYSRMENADTDNLENTFHLRGDLYRYADFIIKGSNGDFGPSETEVIGCDPDAHTCATIFEKGVKPGRLARITTLIKFHNYLDNLWKVKDFDTQLCSLVAELSLKPVFDKLLVTCATDIIHSIDSFKESSHPFFLYKGLQFMDCWKEQIVAIVSDSIKDGTGEDASKATPLDSGLEKLCENLSAKNLFQKIFDDVYFLAKYELYRQIALKHSEDNSIFDAKRLLYSLLIVLYKNRYSNNILIQSALDIIFEPQRKSPNSLWPTGQLFPVSLDGLMCISDIECINDMLENRFLFYKLNEYFNELKVIYDFHARTIQKDPAGNIQGWYPPHFRDKAPLSYITAFTLNFIRRFCALMTYRIGLMVEKRFIHNFKTSDLEWQHLLDSFALKSKLLLMDEAFAGENAATSAILFGLPGTGKTSYARALAEQLGWRFLELTPGDFFSAKEGLIVDRINEIFENLVQLNNTVIFIDEIDDLIKARAKTSADPFDPRNMYVNTLLPKFQELHNQKKIRFILATNHNEYIDHAISREGRIDMILPVGTICPHGRLKLLNQRCQKNGLFIPPQKTEYRDLFKEYLRITEYMRFTDLRSSFDLIERQGIKDWEDMVSCFLKKEHKEVRAFKESFDSRSRPRMRPFHDTDFLDFSHFGAKELKTNLVNKFYDLFHVLYCKGTIENARQTTFITETIEKYCDLKAYGLITPFYDRIVELDEKMQKDDQCRVDLKDARQKLKACILNRDISTNS